MKPKFWKYLHEHFEKKQKRGGGQTNEKYERSLHTKGVECLQEGNN